MEMKEFTNDWFNAIREEIAAGLKQVGEKYGLEIRTGKINYKPGVEFTLALQCQKMATADCDPQKEEWDKECKYYGLTEEMYGKTIQLDGKLFKIIGLNTSAKKNLVRIQSVADQKEYITSAAAVRNAQEDFHEEESAKEQERDWAMSAFLVGLKDVPFGAEFQIENERYRITGINHRAKEYKIIGQRLKDGKQFRFRPEDVRAGMKLDTKE